MFGLKKYRKLEERLHSLMDQYRKGMKALCDQYLESLRQAKAEKITAEKRLEILEKHFMRTVTMAYHFKDDSVPPDIKKTAQELFDKMDAIVKELTSKEE